MGEIQNPRQVLLVVPVISRHEAALAWAVDRSTEVWGDLALRSESFEFTETSFYERTMGANLKKTFLAFARLIDADELASIKRLTNQWELEYAQQSDHEESRPLNLDPGYITEAKLVLATTKDRDHRIYLGDGIYAEITLYYHHGNWTARDWTYPDYRRADFHQFFTTCREYLRSRYRQA